MTQLISSKRFYLLLILAVVGMDNLYANIGKVLIAVGEVNAQRVQLVNLKRGATLLEQDRIFTGKKGRAQLLMIDGAKISVKPLTELFLEEYKFTAEAANVIGSSDSTMTMSIIKGGFRTISGAIGSGPDKSKYLVKTPIATIGIRGTDYSVLICGTDCAALDASTGWL